MRSSSCSRVRWLAPIFAVACGPVAAPPPRAPASEPPPAAAGSPVPRPAILSAHLVRADDPELDGQDGLLVVLDAEVDPAALDARAFALTYDEGEPVVPVRALLSPASEGDENRSVLLLGELYDATAGREPTHVVVIGALWSEDGRSLEGLSAPVEPLAAGPRVVAAELLAPAPGRCEGAAQLVRTYWSAELRGVGADDLPRVRVFGPGVAPRAPSRFDDHADAHGEAGQDNVLDLCLDEAVSAPQVTIEAGAFLDPIGHASAAAELALPPAVAARA